MFENMVVAELLKLRTNRGRDPNLFFVRDPKGFEVDALFTLGRTLLPMEIKSSRTFHPDLAKKLIAFRSLVPESSPPRLVYDGPAYSDRGGVRCVNFRNITAGILAD